MPCTRQRKERFILSFGKINAARSGNDGVSNILSDYGLEALHEWAIDLIVTDLIQSARISARRNAENRKIYTSIQRSSTPNRQMA